MDIFLATWLMWIAGFFIGVPIGFAIGIIRTWCSGRF